MKRIFLFVFLAACVHTPKSTAPAFFPPGNYRHQVHVEILNAPADAPKSLDFQGALKLTHDEIKLVALSPMGTSLFRLTENLKTQEVQKEFYLESMQKNQTQVLRLYSLIRLAILARRDQSQIQQGDSQISFSNLDKDGVPATIKVKNPHFLLSIQVEKVPAS